MIRAVLSLTIIAAFLSTSTFAEDSIKANSAWKGEIKQGAEILKTTITFTHRDGDRIRGEVRWIRAGYVGEHAVSFQGNVIADKGMVVWITDKKEGPVTFPGLYFGTIEGKGISGTWQVPSAGQYGSFSVKLVE